MTRNIKFFSQALIITFMWSTIASCTKKFEDYNTNPANATDSMLQYDNIGKAIFLVQMQKNIMPNATTGDASVYQVAQNLCADAFSGMLSSPTPFGGGKNNLNYSINNGWTSGYFNNELNNVMQAWLQVKQRASVDAPEVFAVAQILKVLSMQRVTDLYGPMPYSQYGQGGFSVGYDSQESIYKTFFTDIDSAILSLDAFIKEKPEAKPIQKFDLVYGSDLTKWIKFANSLRLRIAMRLSYVAPQLAQQQAEKAVADPHGFITDNATEIARIQTQTGYVIVNPLYVIDVVYQGDTRMSADMESFLLGYKDPRIATYFKPSTQFPGTYKGIRRGIDIVSKDDRVNFSSLNTNVNTPVVWMTPAEVCFLRAEGALRGWNMGGNAKDLYEQGVTKSFGKEGFSASQASTYLADGTSKPSAYTDPVDAANNIAATSSDLSKITIKWNESDNFETKLERIITQKWIAIYPEGCEAWAEYRRTGYPKIFPVVVNYSNGVINTKKQIRRLPYPTAEYNSNGAEVAKAVSLLGGPDNGATRLWWDTKNK
ncbi:Susd and RagB outer membrane lipoprotein [bacterium A37T11]|nr:Susd and RagB outer membrane lipoprotein [bacterium A37T11]